MSVVKPARAVPMFSTVDDVSGMTSIPSAQCLETCTFDPAAQWHHRKLMTIESDQSVVLDLMELAITWPELEYSETPTIAPARWCSFVESHHWSDPDRVERIFSLATDIAMTATRASTRPLQSADCHLGQIDDSPPVAMSTIPETRRDRPGLERGVEPAEGWSGRTVARRRR